MRWQWSILVFALPFGCDANSGDVTSAAPSASLRGLDPSLALPANLPEPTLKERQRAAEAASLSGRTLPELLDTLSGRFGDEQASTQYSGVIVGAPDGRPLLESWASDHMRFSDVEAGEPPTVVVVPQRPGSLVCVDSKEFHIPQDNKSPRGAWVSLMGPKGARPPGARAIGFTLRAVGDVPPPPTYAGRFCGVYTGIVLDLRYPTGILVGMFDTRANRRK